MLSSDLITKSQINDEKEVSNFHKDYKLMLGKDFINEIKANPYESTINDSSRSASPAFRKKKGYC